MEMQTMTIGAEPLKDDELEKLKAENKELKARAECAEKELEFVRRDNEMSYMQGKIDGLEFSIRCNGVSGNEVNKA